jgi:stage II sporulation protein D
MSQYGADAMARNGSGYQEILAHYYPGTELVKVHP